MKYVLFVLAVFCAQALSQAPSVVRIRGNVEKFDGKVLQVKARNGQSYSVSVADNLVVVGIVKAPITALSTGKFIGTTTLGERDGSMVALEVHIFPEAMRGTGEGHRDHDLQPGSKMTNANVANIVSMNDARVMTVQYKGGERKVLVTPETQVVEYEPSDKSELKPGAPVYVMAQRAADGTLSAARVNVGLRGQVPPM